MSEPELRFKADDGSEFPEWKLTTINSCCNFYNGDRGKNYPSSNDMVEDGIAFINAGDLVDGKINLDTAKKITREKYNTLGGAKIKMHDILYCLRGSLGKNALVDNIREGTVASSLVVIRPQNINYEFLFYILNSGIEHKQRVLHDEGCAQPNLSAKSVGEFIIPFPCLEEQQKIADLFFTLDNVINSAQKEVNSWEQMKRGVMQKLFSQEVRFKADDGSEFPEWEEIQLGDIITSVNRKADKNCTASVMMISQGNGFIYQSDKYSRDNAGHSLKNYTLLYKGEFAYNHGASKAKPYGITYMLVEEDEARIPYVYHCFSLKDCECKNYWNYALNTEQMDRQLKKLVSSGVRMDGLLNINFDAYASVKVLHPCVEEQQKIADCLSKFDTVIEKTKQKLEAYKQLKKGLMQRMFV